MKRILLTALLVFLFAATQAVASMLPPEPSYSSSVEARFSTWGPDIEDETLTKDSTTYVEIIRSNDEGSFSQHQTAACVDGFEAGAESYASSEFYGGTEVTATASYRQQFRITAAGSASIAFSIDGTMSLSNTAGAGGEVYYSGEVSNTKSWDNITFGYGYTNDTGEEDSYWQDFSRTQSLGWVFRESDIGTTFFIDVSLKTFAAGWISQDEPMPGEGDGEMIDPPMPASFMAESNFMNTLSLDLISGGITPVSTVPVPATVWLLLTGLAGVMGLGRKGTK